MSKSSPNGFNPRSLIGLNTKRSVVLVRSAKDLPVYDKDKRTIELAFFSEEPQLDLIGRTLVYVKLSMDPDAINLERFNGGLAFTENHDIERRLGKGNKPRTDGKLFRATARFSNRPYSEEIFGEVMEDIDNGDIPNTSGIARIDEVAPQPIDRIDGIPVVLATKWTPMEMCIATIGKDKNTGVGRTMATDDPECTDDDCESPDCTVHRTEPVTPATTVTRSATMTEAEKLAAAEAARLAANPLTAMIERQTSYEGFALRFGSTEEQKTELKRTAGAFALSGKSEPEFFAEIQRITDKWVTKVPPAGPIVNLTDKEKREYSISRAIMADAGVRMVTGERKTETVQCFEDEVSQEIQRTLGLNPRRAGFFMPTGLGLRGAPPKEMIQRSGLAVKTSTAGAELVYTEPGSFIEMLRNKAMVIRLGATVLAGLQGNVQFPKQTGAGAASWVTENPGSDVADADLTLGTVTLSPKTLQASTSYSRQLLAQGVVNVDNIVQNDLVQVNGLAVDLAALHGLGSANQPTGLYAQSGVNAVAMGGAITFAKVIDLETAIDAANADVGAMAYLTTPEIRGKAKQVAQLSNTIALPIWQNGEMNGYRAEVSNQVCKVMNSSTPSGGSSHGILFGVWSELLIGEWGAMEVITDPYRLKKQGMIEVTTFLMCDIQVRYAAAFSKGTGLTNT